MLRWVAAAMVAGWKACTKKLSAISCQLSARSKAPLVERGFFVLLAMRGSPVFESRLSDLSFYLTISRQRLISSFVF